MNQLFSRLLIIVFLIFACTGCTFMIAKETVEVLDEVVQEDVNPEKKKKILKKQKTMRDKSREFYCSKVDDKEVCG